MEAKSYRGIYWNDNELAAIKTSFCQNNWEISQWNEDFGNY